MSETIVYKTKGVCSSQISCEVEDNKIVQLKVIGGCNGNLKGISALVKGRDVDEVIDALDGTRCGFKPTSCPDQIAKALKQYKAGH